MHHRLRATLSATATAIALSVSLPANAQVLPKLVQDDDLATLTRKVTQITQIAAKQSAQDYEDLGILAMERKVQACIASAAKNPARSIYCVQYDSFATSFDHSVPPPLRRPFFADATVIRRQAATMAASFTPSSSEALGPMLTSIFVAQRDASAP